MFKAAANTILDFRRKMKINLGVMKTAECLEEKNANSNFE
jgi:hypothetical protein